MKIMCPKFSRLVEVPEATLRAGQALEPLEAVSDAQNMHYGSPGSSTLRAAPTHAL